MRVCVHVCDCVRMSDECSIVCVCVLAITSLDHFYRLKTEEVVGLVSKMLSDTKSRLVIESVELPYKSPK